MFRSYSKHNRKCIDSTWNINFQTYFFHKNSFQTLYTKRSFSVEEELPYANIEYDFRVRIHSGYLGPTPALWSPFDVLPIKSLPMSE